jgi:hypothetical protein
MKFVSPVRSAVLLTALTLSAVVGVGTSAAAAPPVQVQSSCTGDTVAGSVVLKKGGKWPVSVALMSKAHPNSAFAQAAEKPVAGAGSEAPFAFDISSQNPFAFRVDADGVQSRVIPAASCAPGHQVPEAPYALMLPLSLLLLGGLLVARRRGPGRIVA